jgi:hypothetical protein
MSGLQLRPNLRCISAKFGDEACCALLCEGSTPAQLPPPSTIRTVEGTDIVAAACCLCLLCALQRS